MKMENRCGNDGAVENVENQTAVSRVSHRPLEIAHPDFHIPTAATPVPSFPMANNETCSRLRRSHDHKKGANHCGKEPEQAVSFRLISRWNETSVSGSLRIGIKTAVQAHFWIGKC